MRCIAAGCGIVYTRRRPHDPANLCPRCYRVFQDQRKALGGYISSLDLRDIAAKLLAEKGPMPSEQEAAIRHMRGPLYPEGDWSLRPPFRQVVLFNNYATKRLPHLLVGRRQVPSANVIVAGLVHWVLCHTVLGTDRTYAQFLAGATFFARRCPIAPAGADTQGSTPEKKLFRMTHTDYSTIGRRVLYASRMMQLKPKSLELRNTITDLYFDGLARGDYHRPVAVYFPAVPTYAAGDHPLDHVYFDRVPEVPLGFYRKARRSSGRMGGVYPEIIDIPMDERAERSRKAAKARAEAHRLRTSPPPSVDWIF